MAKKDREELLRYLRGIEKKHGSGVELVVKVETKSGKVRRRTGSFLGLKGEEEVGLHNDAKGSDSWYSIDLVHDVWKKGSQQSEG